ncbi:MAG: hypothetical protein AB1938_30215 [Myxococcota bacterium]
MIPSEQPPLPPGRGLGRGATLGLLLAASLAHAHPQGFHKKLTFTLTKTTVTGLVVMDVDSGERCTVLRQAADADGDGVVKGAEVTALKERLTSMATRTLKLGVSGAAIAVTVKESKLSLREDPRVGEAGLSVAVLIELTHPHEVSEGMSFEVTDTSPDLSPVVVQVFQAAQKGTPPEAPFQSELEAGKTVKVRLGRLP